MTLVRTLIAASVSAGLLLAHPSGADADDGSFGAAPGGNGFAVAGTIGSQPQHHDAATASAIGSNLEAHWTSHPLCDFGGAATCADYFRCPDGTAAMLWTLTTIAGRELRSYFQCPQQPPPAAAAPPQITNALVLRALRRVELPASKLGVQPPGGETLVNFKTNFFTDAGAFTRSVQLLGRRVDLRIWPARFHWVFGDGADLASTSAGARYPDLEITHAYESRGRVSPSVDTTYAARYRVDGGAWRDVEWTVTIPGEPVRLQVRTARPVLVSHG